MPIYEFKCCTCGTITEQIFSITSFPREIQCTQCFNKADKIISKSSFRLEGGGWAADGYTTNMEKFKHNMQSVDNY